MESLKINTGVVRLEVQDDYGDVRGIFKFNPEDIESAKALMRMQNEIRVKQAELEELSKTCETDEQKVDFLLGVCTTYRTMIDECFGSGSSDILFGDANTLDMFEQFFDGILPYYQRASQKRQEKYKQKSGN